MMRRLFLAGTLLFWLLLIALWLASRQSEPPVADIPAPALRTLPLAEVARHATPADCWMAIDGMVYDLTAYLPDHPSKPSIIEPWCGREASEAYRTKTKGRPHSPEAEKLLPTFRIGRVAQP